MVEYWVGRLMGASWAKLGSSPRVPRGAHGDRLKLGSLDLVGLRPSSRCNFVVYLGVDQRPDANEEDDRA